MGIFSRARNTDPITSHEAAATISNPVFTSRTETVYNLLYVDLTDEQLVDLFDRAARLGICKPASPQGIRSARAKLVDAGKVEAVPDQFGITAMGNKCHIWRRVQA